MKEKIIIDGVDVSECEQIFVQKKCALLDQVYCEDNLDCYYKQLKRLEQENEKIKKQYNCYACGNCKGTEDYINLEKHHKGLRKQFDIFVKRNNELSLRIEQLEQENENLKEENEKLKEELASFMNGDYCAKGCKKMNNAFQDVHKAILKENEELKQTIKELTQSLDDCNVQRTQLKARLTPLEDSYFKGLSSIEIAGLAKKSIRITTYNRQLETALEEIKGTIKHFKTYFSEKELKKVKFNDITVIEEIIAGAIGE